MANTPGRPRWWSAGWGKRVDRLVEFGGYLLHVDLHIDQLFFKDLATAPDAFPGRMSPFTALNFALLGLALLLFHRPRKHAFSAACLLALPP